MLLGKLEQHGYTLVEALGEALKGRLCAEYFLCTRIIAEEELLGKKVTTGRNCCGQYWGNKSRGEEILQFLSPSSHVQGVSCCLDYRLKS